MDNLLDHLSVFLESDDTARPEPAAAPSNLVPFPQPTPQSETVPHPQDAPPKPQDVPPQPQSLTKLESFPESSTITQVADPTVALTPDTQAADPAVALIPDETVDDETVDFEQSITVLLELLAPAEQRETTLNALQQLILLLGEQPAVADPTLSQTLTQDLDHLTLQQQELRSHLDRLAARIEQISQVTTHHNTRLANVQPENSQPDKIQNASSVAKPTPPLPPPSQPSAIAPAPSNAPGTPLLAVKTATALSPSPDPTALSQPELIAPESQQPEPIDSSSDSPAQTADESVHHGLDRIGLDIVSTELEATELEAIAPDSPSPTVAARPSPDVPPQNAPITPAMPSVASAAIALSNAQSASAPPNPPVPSELSAAASTFQTVNPELASQFEFVPTKTNSTTIYSARRSSRWRWRWLALGLGGLAFLGIPWGIYHWLIHPQQVLETQLAHTFAADSQLAIYRLNAVVKRNRIELSGILPSRQLRAHAQDVVRELAPNLMLQDQTIVVDGTVTQAVQQLSQTLNQMEGIDLVAIFAEGTVTLTGTTIYPGSREDLTTAFARLPGVEQVDNQVQLQLLSIATRIYFGQNTTQLKAGDEAAKIQPLVALLKNNPQLQIRIVGYGHSSESNPAAIARARVQAIQTRLEDQGIDRGRLQTSSRTTNPPGMAKGSDRWLGRCVLFEVIEPRS